MEILIFLYMTTAVVGIVSYITQFHKLIIDKTNSASVSILSLKLPPRETPPVYQRFLDSSPFV